MSVLIKSNKMSEVSGALANLSGIVSVQDIIDTILQISNLKSTTLESMKSDPYDSDCNLMPISDIYIDMSYQRRVRLRLILQKLKSLSGYDPIIAGAIDVAIRPTGEHYAWDGLRRAIMAGLCGLTEISVSTYQHPPLNLNSDCVKNEAEKFKIRNADSEKMKPEEIFKSMVAYHHPESMELLKVLKNADLDVEGLNPRGKVLGGFRELQINFNLQSKALTEMEIVTASQIIQHVYTTETNVSVYLLCGLAWLLQVNETVDTSYSEQEITESFQSYVQTNERQTSLTNRRLGAKQRESVAYMIAKKVLRDENGLTNKIGLKDVDIELIEDSI